MTIYVDDYRAEFKPSHRPGRRYVMCHMISTDDTHAELHAMADKIGVLRKWFQGDHYDITLSKRALALTHGALLIPVRVLAFMACNRRFGFPMGTPETAEKIARERFEQAQRG